MQNDLTGNAAHNHNSSRITKEKTPHIIIGYAQRAN